MVGTSHAAWKRSGALAWNRRRSRQSAGEPVVERQHLVRFGLLPHSLIMSPAAPVLLSRDRRPRKIPVEMKQLPFVVLERRARWMIATAFQPFCQRPRCPNISKYCGEDFEGAAASDTSGQSFRLRSASARSPRSRWARDVDQVEQGRYQVAGMNELMAQFALAATRFGHDNTKGSRMPPPWVFCL